MPTIDFDKANAGFIVVPTGTYNVRIQGYERKPAKSTGNDMIQWKAVIMDGEYEGVQVSDFTSMSEKALWRIANLVKSANVQVAGMMDTEGPKFRQVLDAAIGQTLYWNIDKTVNDQGQDTNKVKGYAPDKDCEPKTIGDSPEDLPDFLKG